MVRGRTRNGALLRPLVSCSADEWSPRSELETSRERPVSTPAPAKSRAMSLCADIMRRLLAASEGVAPETISAPDPGTLSTRAAACGTWGRLRCCSSTRCAKRPFARLLALAASLIGALIVLGNLLRSSYRYLSRLGMVTVGITTPEEDVRKINCVHITLLSSQMLLRSTSIKSDLGTAP